MKTDSEIKRDVLSELLWDPLISEAKVGVTVNEGVVTLTGHLDTYAEKVAAKRAPERVAGVKAIALELEVIPSGVHQRSDTEIALAVERSEVTLRGLVLPVGGIKEKVLAELAAGISTVMLPARNRTVLDDVPAQARAQLEFICLDDVEQALQGAIDPAPSPG